MKEKLRLAFDLDGVISDQEIIRDRHDKMEVPVRDIEIPALPHIIVITARGEKDREVTERWLEKNNIPCDELIMIPGFLDRWSESTDEDEYAVPEAREKIKILEEKRPLIYVEDNRKVREEIERHISETQVLSPQEWESVGSIYSDAMTELLGGER